MTPKTPPPGFDERRFKALERSGFNRIAARYADGAWLRSSLQAALLEARDVRRPAHPQRPDAERELLAIAGTGGRRCREQRESRHGRRNARQVLHVLVKREQPLGRHGISGGSNDERHRMAFLPRDSMASR